MANPAPQWIASGNIYPSRFVKQPVGTGFTVAQATLNANIVGISQEGTDTAPGTGGSGYAATDGENLKVYSLTDQCLLMAGAGGWLAGNRLESDADGKGIPIAGGSAVSTHIGAIALDNAAAGELVLVQIVRYDTITADS